MIRSSLRLSPNPPLVISRWLASIISKTGVSCRESQVKAFYLLLPASNFFPGNTIYIVHKIQVEYDTTEHGRASGCVCTEIDHTGKIYEFRDNFRIICTWSLDTDENQEANDEPVNEDGTGYRELIKDAETRSQGFRYNDCTRFFFEINFFGLKYISKHSESIRKNCFSKILVKNFLYVAIWLKMILVELLLLALSGCFVRILSWMFYLAFFGFYVYQMLARTTTITLVQLSVVKFTCSAVLNYFFVCHAFGCKIRFFCWFELVLHLPSSQL